MNNKLLNSVRMTAVSGMLVALGLTASAQAEDIDCASIGGLQDCLGYLDFNDTPDKPSKIRVGLEKKLTDAETKISKSKYCEASFKIEDFNAKINQLIDSQGRGKPKVGELYEGTLLCLELGSDAVVEELDPDDECGSKTKGPRNK